MPEWMVHPNGAVVAVLVLTVFGAVALYAWLTDRRNLLHADTPPPLDMDELHQRHILDSTRKGYPS